MISLLLHVGGAMAIAATAERQQTRPVAPVALRPVVRLAATSCALLLLAAAGLKLYGLNVSPYAQYG